MRKLILFFGVMISIALVISCSSDSKSLSATPSKLNFDKINLGDKVSLDVVVKNKYGDDVFITGINISGSSDFSITSVLNTPYTMVKNEELTITVEYNAVTPGDVEALIEINHNGSTKPKEIGVIGEGIPVPKIAFSTTDFDFGNVVINTSKTHDIEIENIGTADLTIDNLTIVGTGITISNGGSTPIIITSGAKHIITVKFDPITTVGYQIDITVDSDAVNMTFPTITVKGTGVIVTPKLTVNRTDPWDFGSVSSNLPSILDLTMENTGGDPLTITDVTMQTGVDFTVDSIKNSNDVLINLPQVLQPGAKIKAMIKFEPTANNTLNDKISIIHDGINVGSPLEINVTGVGRVVQTKTFNYTGAAQSWTVPAGVSQIQIECWGAEGATADGTGGKGGYSKGILNVTPGETLNIYVGGKNGWNGGGANSVGGGTSSGPLAPGANGGGASDVRQGGTALTDRKIVAGAGGGGGGNGAGSVYGPGGNGGAGGGTNGNAGVSGNGGTAGQGGTQTAGGANGTGNSNCGITGESGKPGTLGNGGDGGDGIQGCGGYTGGGGGGGGGGYYGGGGAGGAAAGGGGAWAGGGGGGGSSYIGGVSSGSTQAGTQSGDGEIKITY